MKGKVLFIGTGSSAGVPLIGCDCSVCSSGSSFNKRLRPSALVKLDDRQFLIDAGPDFRTQALYYQIKKLDGVLITHAHHDHTAGIDELGVYYYKSKKSLPMLLSRDTAEDIQKRYYYIFRHNPIYDNLVPKLSLNILPESEGEIVFEGIPISYMTYEQGGMKVNGFRFGDFAYLSDISVYDPSIFHSLKGVKVLVISALRHQVSPLHFSLGQAVNFINQVGAEQAWLTHMSHELEHSETNAALPPHIRLAYDGLEITFG
jgi:phosphoribosyl 1,2-cyclic phosphate phosphodiesterase